MNTWMDGWMRNHTHKRKRMGIRTESKGWGRETEKVEEERAERSGWSTASTLAKGRV